MKTKPSLRLTPLLACLVAAHAASAATYQWNAASGLLPDQVAPPMTLVDESSPENPQLSGGVLTIQNDVHSERLYYSMADAQLAMPTSLSITAEVRLVSGTTGFSGRTGCIIGFATAPGVGGALYIGADEIFLQAPGGGGVRGPSASVDTDGSFHTYRIETTGTSAGSSLQVLQDNVLRLTGTLYANGADFEGYPIISFGEGSSGAAGTSEWKSFSHNAAAVGALQVNITPPGAVSAGGQWQVDGGPFQNSGAVVADLAPGNHTVAFKSVAGWSKPGNQSVTIVAGATNTVSGNYIAFNHQWNANSGLLPNQILQPYTLFNTATPEVPILSSVLTIGTDVDTENMYYQMDGSDVLMPTNLVIEFGMKFVSGATGSPARTPAGFGFETEPNVGGMLWIGQDTAFLLSAPFTIGATTNVDTDGAFHTYQIKVSGTGPGSAISVFQDGNLILTGATYADNSGHWQGVPRILWGEISLARGVLEFQNFSHNAASVSGALQVNITPPGAVAAGAQWQVDGGAFQNSGAVVTNLSAGNHTVAFKAVAGWSKPGDQNVTVVAGATNTVSGNYTALATLFVSSAEFSTNANEVRRFQIGPLGTPVELSPIIHASLNAPHDVVLSPNNELFVVNRHAYGGGNGSVSRFLNPAGTPVFNGVISNGFNTPAGAAFRGGELFVTDIFNNRIRRFTFDGSGAPIEGTPITSGLSGATVRYLALTLSGNELLVTECCGANRIRRYLFTGNAVTPNGTIEGNGLNSPHFMAFSPAGELFVANTESALHGHSLSRFTFSNGVATANGTLTGNNLDGPVGVAFSPWGELFVANFSSPFISRWTISSNGTATTNAPMNITADWIALTFMNSIGDSTGALQVNITPPGAIAGGAQWQVDGGPLQNSGAVVTGLSAGNHTVAFKAVAGWTTPSNQTVTVNVSTTNTATGNYSAPAATLFASSQSAGVVYRYQLGPVGAAVPLSAISHASLSVPSGLAVSTNGELFIVNRGPLGGSAGSVSRFLDPAGVPNFNGIISGGFNTPHGAAFRGGQLLVVDSFNNRVRRFDFDVLGAPTEAGAITSGLSAITARYVVVSLFDGEVLVGECCSVNDVRRYLISGNGITPNGMLTGNGINNPQSMAFSPAGELFVASYDNNSVSRFTFSNGVVTANGTLTGNSLSGPVGVEFSPWGELFVVNATGTVISRWTISTGGTAMPNGTLTVPGDLGDLVFINSTGSPVPEIAVEHPPGNSLADGLATVNFGGPAVGGNALRTFTIRNSGGANLTGLGITIDGTHAGDFTVTTSPTVPVGSNATTTFTVRFLPSACGARMAALHLASNDGDENPFDIMLTGTGADLTPPSLTCPANVSARNDPGQCSRRSVFYNVTFSDNCPGAILTQTAGLPSGSTFPKGTTTNRFTATDASGNSNTCSFTVTINDLDLPAITCPGNLVFPADAGRCSRAGVTYNVVFTDNCPGATLMQSAGLPSGSTFPKGVTTNRFTVIDASGNSHTTNTCSFTITVLDTEPPAITCPTNLVLTAAPGVCAAYNVTFAASATDNCNSSVAVTCAPASGSNFPIGQTTVRCTATDDEVNTNTCSFTVTVRDAERSVLICPTNLVLQSNPGQSSRSNVVYFVTATDNCNSNLVAQCVPPSRSIFNAGTTTVRCTVADAAGNTNACAFTVTVLASTITIGGRITNCVTGEGIANGIVMATGVTQPAVTDATGHYVLANVPAAGTNILWLQQTSGLLSGLGIVKLTGLTNNLVTNFCARLYLSVRGEVIDQYGLGLPNTTLRLSGSVSASFNTESRGGYWFRDLPGGTITVTPSNGHVTFSPPSRTFTNIATNQVVNFVGTCPRPPAVPGSLNLPGRIAVGRDVFPDDGCGAPTRLPVSFGTVWSPDGSRLLFGYDSEIYAMNADGSDLTRLTFDNSPDRAPVWSPNGSQIAYISGGSFSGQSIIVMNSNGSNPRTLTSDVYFDSNLSWSPDGSRIAYIKNLRIATVNLNGGGHAQVPTLGADDGVRTVGWSPDGTRLAYGGWRRISNTYTWRFSSIPGGILLPSFTAPPAYSMTWSPDSTRVAFVRNNALYTARPDGTDLRRVSQETIYVYDGVRFGGWGRHPVSFTAPGLNRTVQSGRVSVTFSNVSIAGETAVMSLSPYTVTVPAPRGYFGLGSYAAYDIVTAASNSGPITITFSVPYVTNAAEFARLRVLHGENGVLVDRTILPPNTPAPNFAARTISARVASLSPFAIVQLIDESLPQISGVVVNDNGEPLPDVAVTLSGDSAGEMLTDIDGRFRFPNIESNGNYTVIVADRRYVFDPPAMNLPDLTGSADVLFVGTVAPPLPVPSLAIGLDARFENQPTLTWPGQPFDFLLEATDSLSDTNWFPAFEPLFPTPDGNAVPLTPVSPERYYRLRSP